MTLSEKHALIVRIIGVPRTRFWQDFIMEDRQEDSAAEYG